MLENWHKYFFGIMVIVLSQRTHKKVWTVCVCSKGCVGEVRKGLAHLHSPNRHSWSFSQWLCFPSHNGLCQTNCLAWFYWYFCVPVVHVSAVPEFSLYPFLWNLPPGYKTTEPLTGPWYCCSKTLRLWKVKYICPWKLVKRSSFKMNLNATLPKNSVSLRRSLIVT